MKKGLLQWVWVGLFLVMAGCQSSNRFSAYGPEIIVYEGDSDVLSNCCHAAMSLLADDIKQEAGMELSPSVNVKVMGRSWSQDGQTVAHRTILTCIADGELYRIEISKIEKKPSTVIIESPTEDFRLVNHLMKLFKNFDVEPVTVVPKFDEKEKV